MTCFIYFLNKLRKMRPLHSANIYLEKCRKLMEKLGVERAAVFLPGSGFAFGGRAPISDQRAWADLRHLYKDKQPLFLVFACAPRSHNSQCPGRAAFIYFLYPAPLK